MANEVLFRQDAPALLTAFHQGGATRRPARLFVAGEYPDKGVSITPDDLDGVIARFHAGGGSAPVHVEHIETALSPLGHVVALYREGDALYGMLEFSAGIAEHLDARKAQHLSVALIRFSAEEGGGYGLKETSIVLEPRIKTAQFLAPEQIAAKLSEFKAAGKITPAMEPHVSALLHSGALVTFADGSEIPVQSEALALLSALPVVQPRGGGGVVPVEFKAPAREAAGAAPALAPEIERMISGMGGDPAKIAATMAGKGR